MASADDVRLDLPYGSFKKSVLPKWAAAALQLVIDVVVWLVAIPLQIVMLVSDYAMLWLFGFVFFFLLLLYFVDSRC